jgi:cytochrome c biogenesis protein CcdA/thiol-disulfide isomerase/thioredoxin
VVLHIAGLAQRFGASATLRVMALLVVFALVAGAGTALSPCVLPVLPALLSACAVGGRRRPVGIALGLALTFTVTIVGLASVIDGVGLGPGATRTLAVVVLLVFGVVVALPSLAARVEAPLARLSRLGPRGRGDGFASGLIVGGALGFVYAPCAGPILAAVIAVGAASSRTVPVGLAFALGSALVLLALSLGGRSLAGRVHGPTLQRALGVVLIATGIAMATNLDVRFESAIADHLPEALVFPTRSLETSHGVSSRLDDLRGKPRFAVASTGHAGVSAARLPRYGAAPDFAGNQRWFNTPGDRPLTLAGLRGHVVLIDFWTYTCINCLRTLPYLEAWDARYRRDGLVIVGVHSPEFPFERGAANVAAAIRREGIRYPVVQDNHLDTWNAWGNQYWPAEYLVDANGQVRHAHFGEGEYDATEMAIRALLREAGHPNPGAMAMPKGVVHPTAQATPETYVGLARAERFDTPPQPGTHTYVAPRELATSHFALSGTWREDAVAATAVRDAEIRAQIAGKDAYLVLSPPNGAMGRVMVLLDGRPIATARVDRQRLYHLVSNPRPERHRLTLRFSPGVQAYAFTFG